MIDKFLKIAGVNNMDDFYKLHPTAEHFFKTYPNAKKELTKKKLKKAAKGGIQDIPSKLIPYFEEQMKRQGKVLLTDKGNNLTYYGTKKPDGSWDVNSFEVLSGRNPNDNAVNGLTVAQLENLPDKRVTPIGIFPLKYNKNIYGMPGYDLTGSGNIAYHTTYVGADDPNRAALYANNNNEDNYRSFGCINCQKPSMEHLLQFVGNDPHVSTYVVNSNLSEAENRSWFNANTPKYVYNAETGQTQKVVPVKKTTTASVEATMNPKRAAAIANADVFGLNPYKPWYHVDGQVPAVPNPTGTPQMYSPEYSKKLANARAFANEINSKDINNRKPLTPAQQSAQNAQNDKVMKQFAMQHAQGPAATPAGSNTQIAKDGTEQVVEFQKFLNQAVPGVNLVPDGAWGPKTQAAYEAYMAKQKGAPLIEHTEYEYGGETYSENNNSMKNKKVRRYQKGGKAIANANLFGLNTADRSVSAPASGMDPVRAAMIAQSFNPLGVNKPTTPMMMVPSGHVQAQKPMYSPEVLAKIKAEAHQLNEDELRNQYHTQAAQRTANDQALRNKADKSVAMQTIAEGVNKPSARKSSYNLAKGGSESIAKFQEMLNNQTGSTLVPDGAWGPKTQAAYEQYMAMKSGKTKPAAPAQSFKFNAANVYADDMANPDMSMSIDSGKEEPMPSRPYGMVGPPTQEQWEETHPLVQQQEHKANSLDVDKEAYSSNNPAKNMKRYGGYYQNGGGVDPMQIVKAYAQAAGVDPKQIMAQLQEMAPEEQQAALQQMMEQLQGGQQKQYAMGGRNTVRRPRHQSPDETMQQLMYSASENFKREGNPEKVFNYIQSQGVSEQAAMLMLRQIINNAENGDETYLPAEQEAIPIKPIGYEMRPDDYMGKNEEDYKYSYAKGGIHIKPSRRGTFTAQATRMGMGVQEAARHILANKDRYSSKMVKKANFARNASKWKHEDGGYAGMYQEGGEAMPQEMMEAPQQQMQEQAMGQEQQQGGQDQMMQQLMQMVAQALQQGTPPEQIVQMLVQQGVPEEVAVQAVQMVMQQMGGGAPQGGPGQQYQPQGGQYQGPQPMAAMGGYYANGGINNAGFRALPPSVQQKIMDNMAYGGYYEDGGFFNQSYMPFDY